ncbi:MAG: hypothetical protein CVV64_12765 [Candidatus Wallbacteria bacterium HGW-Wallbacteria-1]|jgi:mutator protein MutT|uniref:Oxidized purine nucleoside triphosphate hydrolase n=1 Tax=Candidatus Wallbacteria bacterium HGW-Wallbacteria-1 TaxID=2013854 RepID=A0A2N1PN63_9BACT|nr:MAG: hypothetical protein CVV64_12765 [Candidatus Wallbacteria bacterium HGW-Wallbacteria-1]
MKLAEYKNMAPPLRQRTLCFLLHNEKVLLGLKKSGFGKGNWLGIGGKVEPDETIEQAAIREMEEEICVTPENFNKVATLNFYFPQADNPARWNQQVIVFIVNEWHGEITETDEIKPKWFPANEIPFESMWDDAQYWLPAVLDDKQLKAEFLFNQDLEVIEKTIVITSDQP